MVTTKLSLADYMSLEDRPGGPCEFVDGEIVEMSSESEENVLVVRYLMAQFLQLVSDGLYEAEELRPDGVLQPPQFPGLELSVDRALAPKG